MVKINKWKVLDSKLVLDEKWYKVRQEKVEIKPGKIADDYFLGIFNDIVMVAAITADSKIPLVKQYKHGAGEILLELPAGYIEDDEEPLAAAKRELAEETGFTAPTWHKLGFFYRNPTKARGNAIHLFLALNAEETHPQVLDDNENIELVIRSFHEAVSMAKSGKLKVSDTVLALLLAQQKLVESS
ncbi:MAG: hypothetical protein A3E37_05395 [Candidatus Andersenbacteria bacterium RIFCSPHIGHO2_12_FULL_46_9]|nr:MAG: hypothetical protein A3B76_05870 [Candidatus Andersenbacteria bacterium RIFCSPHIGHO2_02_FULL_46_16]OGY35698.1 MAG: hypothetical protein A3E37_05395 [Candidatus Andersenbacteria bacterium RIFCSPHIGHO2_12_FULL_46_9]OGY38882.1 MAG: hypothetical protein A3G57_02190 [Candidatus Andersenbacteria bacterium RIFCSPLOWO2_12_FULL_45_8]